MRAVRPFAIAASAALLLGSPAAVLAQSAGDDQYVDPFATPTAQATPQATASPAPLAPGPPASTTPAPSATAAPPATAAPAGARDRLPDTGADPVIVALAGVGLLFGGFGLRRLTLAGAR